jgi:hypothetical protein
VFVVGLGLLVIAVVVIVLAVRRRPAPAAPYGAGMPMAAGQPPYWAPPAPVDRTTAADARLETPSPAPPQQPPTP